MANLKELIENNYDAVVETLKEAEASAYRYPECEYRAWIDSEGETGVEEWVAGSNGRYQFHDPDYARYYLYTACRQFYDILFDYWFFDGGEAAYCFREEFGVELDLHPVDEDGDEIDESIYDNMLRQCRVSGIDSERFEAWLKEQEENAVDSCVNELDTGLIIDEAVKNAEGWV